MGLGMWASFGKSHKIGCEKKKYNIDGKSIIFMLCGFFFFLNSRKWFLWWQQQLLESSKKFDRIYQYIVCVDDFVILA
jgi:hypothetical protein